MYRETGEKKGCYKQLLVPECKRTEVMRAAHESLVGHPGISNSSWRIGKHFFWPGIFEEIRRYCKSCYVCLKMSKQTTKKD